MYTNSTKDIQNNKEAKNTRGSRKIFSRSYGFYRFTEQQIPRPVDNKRRKMYYSGKKKRHTIKNQIMVNNRGYIIHKSNYKKGKRHDYDIYKRNHPVTPKQVVNVVDLGYLGVEKDFPEQLSALPCKKKRNHVFVPRRNRTQQNSFYKENSNRTYYLQIEKIQDYERYI